MSTLNPLIDGKPKYRTPSGFPWSDKRIEDYAAFLKQHPDPKMGEDYHSWYAKLKTHMEALGHGLNEQ